MSQSPTGLAFMVSHVVEGRSFALASFVLIIWDYFITLNEEVQHFWSGPWSISRILFLCNRYFTPGLLTFRLLVDFYPGLFPSEVRCCDLALRINFPLNMFALAVIQGILIVRLWYLFHANKTARYCLLLAYVWCTAASVVMLIMQFHNLHSHLVHMPMVFSFCADPAPSQFWVVFVPSFALHGVLSLFMIFRVIHNMRTAKHLPLLKRCVKDGGFLYMVIFFSVSFSISAAIVGVFMLALLSICVSRVILHLSDLAQAYSVDPISKAPALLLATAMVDRVAWEKKMGCLIFVPPHHDKDMDDDIEDYY
ncbi:hypothetical protein DFH07DRAFT_796204 [Mycena maculata]|uniref:DUF6533 domain-containing protein n=1 Tax=Mycena maculata TaxID=230809 RepID=A0AAD7K5N2_9AGAR|nr:hypothetical protein DFH07DRAFT_796204 [Mycena maculata]